MDEKNQTVVASRVGIDGKRTRKLSGMIVMFYNLMGVKVTPIK